VVTAEGRGNSSDRGLGGPKGPAVDRLGEPDHGDDRGAIGLADDQLVDEQLDEVDTFDTDAYHETRAQREARAASGMHPGRYRAFDLSLLRFGVRPFLMVMDALAYFAAAAIIGHLTNTTLGVFALIVVLYAVAGLYRSRLTMSVLDDLPALAGRAVGAAALVTAAGFVWDKTQVSTDLLWTSAVFAGLVVFFRCIGYSVVRAVRRRSFVAHPTLILGAGRIGGTLASELLAHPEYGLKPVGFLDSDPLLEPEERPVPLLGGHESLAKVIVEFGVGDVIIAFGSAPESQMVDFLRTCDRLDCEIFFVPRLFEMHHISRDMDQVWGLPLVRLRRAAFRTFSWRLKRLMDVLVSGFALFLLSPVMGAIALAVRFEGGPGIIFRQERVGLDGRPFQVMKFRSLKPVDNDESQTKWNIAHDDRLGPIGRILRKTSLDELPQLINILKGDMTLVGPRPERPHFVAQFTESFPRYTARHRVPAGLTGWAQVHGLRGDTSIEDRARFDNYYIENWSLWADVKIILRTVASVVRGSGG
jgi:exopolysaccharide biosynthesis polyprenyl glycosylphosphotransferase